MEQVLTAALSPDNETRRQAEYRISYAAKQRGFAVALAEAVEHPQTGTTDNQSTFSDASSQHLRLMAGVLLQRFVQDFWERASNAVLPLEDKVQASPTVLFLVTSLLSFEALVRMLNRLLFSEFTATVVRDHSPTSSFLICPANL